MSLIANLFYTRPRIEQALSALDKSRLKLPVLNLRALWDGFDDAPVTVRELPSGPWSSPLVDVVMLAKITRCLKPRHVLEVGSYRGYTTKILAEHTPPDTRIVAFDRDERHGAAYRDLSLADKIERRVGAVSTEAFANDPRGHYDLIFLDADHTYEAVKHDTDILLPLLAADGIFVWHDYANWGRFSRKNGVPEALHKLARTLPVVAIGGSWLAAYSPYWASNAGAEDLAQARQTSLESLPGENAWTTSALRG